jgi:hypothetical protein
MDNKAWSAREQSWKRRTNRLKRIIELDLPHWLVQRECIQVLRTYGLVRVLCREFFRVWREHLWYRLRVQFWHGRVLGKSEQEIDKMIEAEFERLVEK